MFKSKQISWIPWILFIILLTIIWLSMNGCSSLKEIADNQGSKHGVTWADRAWHPIASMASYKVAIIYRGDYRAGDEYDIDFYRSIERKVAWLESNGWEILDKSIEEDYDMTRREILRFAVIKYKEIR